MDNPAYIDDRNNIKNGIINKKYKKSEADTIINNHENNQNLNNHDNIDNKTNIKLWSSYTKSEKTRYIIFAILKIFLFVILLYLFLLSLNFMTIGFTLVSNYTLKAGPTIKFLLSNPFAALAVGIILTALMQNATATTSIAISMVGAKIIPDVKTAIPIIMGSNIGKGKKKLIKR